MGYQWDINGILMGYIPSGNLAVRYIYIYIYQLYNVIYIYITDATTVG